MIKFIHQRGHTFLAVVFGLFASMVHAQHCSSRLHDLITSTIANPCQYLSEEKIIWLNESEQDQLANFIYAREFPSERDSGLQFYFNWSDSTLTAEIRQSEEFYQATRYNKDLLYAFKIQQNIYPFVEETLTGDWQQGSSVTGSGSSNSFSFYAGDQSFSYENGNPQKGDRLYAYSGFYVLDSSSIELEIRFKENWVGGDIIQPDNAASENEWEFSGAELVLTELEEGYEYRVMTISQIHVLTFDGVAKMYLFLDNQVYWKTAY